MNVRSRNQRQFNQKNNLEKKKTEKKKTYLRFGSEIVPLCQNESVKPEKGDLNIGVHATIKPDE